MPIQMFDDGHEEFNKNIAGFGKQVAGLITERLHKKQFEDFLSGPTKDFQDHMKQATEILMDEDNPEGPAQGMTMLKSGLETYMDEGARYADNPIIQGRVSQAFQMNMKMLDMEFKMHHERSQNEKADATAKHEVEKWGVEKENIQAQTKQRLAKADASGREHQDAAQGTSLFSGAPSSLTSEDDEGRTNELWGRISNTIDKPKNEAERKAVDAGLGENRTQMAQQKLAEMAGRGELRPGKTDSITGVAAKAEPWDVYNQDHLAAVAGTIDPATVRNNFIWRKAQEEGPQQGVNPKNLDDAYGVLIDPTKANAFRPLKTPVSSENLGKILLGSAGWSGLADPTTHVRPKNLTEAAQRLPATLDAAQGPIADKYKKLASGEGLMGVDRSQIKTVDDMKKLMNQQAVKLILAVIGDNAVTGKLPAGMAENRDEAGEFASAMTEKYAQQIFEQVTGKKPAEAPGSPTAKKSAIPSGIDAALSIFGKPVGRAARAVTGGTPTRGIFSDFSE